MFMGHYGPAVWDTQRGRTQPLIHLWQAFLAVQAVDVVFAVLAILGIEGSVMKGGEPVFHIPWSHSLLTSILIAVAAGLVFRLLKPSAGMKGFWVITLLAFSHWVLDLIVHRPDLPLYPGGEVLLGFGIWNYPIAAYALEMGLLFAGFLYWIRLTRPKTKMYAFAPWLLFGFMGIIQFSFITLPGLQLQTGTFDPASQPQGAFLGLSALFTFGLLAVLIALIEKGRPSKFT